MLIHHGTKSHLLNEVRRSGIRPRGSSPSQWTELPSRSDLVYLTTYAHFFYGRDGAGLSVVELDSAALDNKLLLPDEDYLHQVHKMTLDEARKRLEEFQGEWEASLRDFGTCAYKGPIDARCIRQACFIDTSDVRVLTSFYGSFEIMETGLEEFRSKGQLIGRVTDWVFDRSGELPPEIKWDAKIRNFVTLL